MRFLMDSMAGKCRTESGPWSVALRFRGPGFPSCLGLGFAFGAGLVEVWARLATVVPSGQCRKLVPAGGNGFLAVSRFMVLALCWLRLRLP